jgi:capsular exopolysaccharide synthesis family protein
VSKIFEGLDYTAHPPMNNLNGDRTATSNEPEHSAGPRVTQASFASVPIADGPAHRTKVGPSPALEMDMEARQELTKLTHRLFLGSNGPRVVAFSGVQEGAGCSWMLARTAQLLAEADAGSVCVIDADLRNPTLHKYFRVGNSFGLSDALIGTQPVSEYVSRLGGPLHLLSSGSVIPKVETLLSSSTFRLRVEELCVSFRFVLFDTPPLAGSSDALVVASRTDGLVMVIEADSTNRDLALKAAKDASATNVHLLGTVLNKRTFPIPEAIFRKL